MATLPTPTLMLVTDRRLAGGEDALVRAVCEAVAGGVNVVQLREKDLPQADLLRLALRLREATAGRALLLVNSSLDVAREAGADGVHLPEDMLAQGWGPEARRLIVGRSVHSVAAARKAVEEGVDYLVAGPVFETRSHPDQPPVGLRLVREVAAGSGVPVIGIGGITAENALAVLAASAVGVAVISAVLGTRAPAQSAADLWAAVSAPHQPAGSSLQER